METDATEGEAVIQNRASYSIKGYGEESDRKEEDDDSYRQAQACRCQSGDK